VGSWTVIEKTSTLDDRPVVVLANRDRANAVTLVLRCQEGQAEAYVKANFVMAATDKSAKTVPLPYGFDAEPPKAFTGPASQDLTGCSSPMGRVSSTSCGPTRRWRSAINDRERHARSPLPSTSAGFRMPSNPS